MAKKRKKKKQSSAKTNNKTKSTDRVQDTNEPAEQQTESTVTQPKEAPSTSQPSPQKPPRNRWLGTGHREPSAIWFHWLLNLIAAIAWTLPMTPFLQRLLRSSQTTPLSTRLLDLSFALVSLWLLLRVLTIPIVDMGKED